MRGALLITLFLQFITLSTFAQVPTIQDCLGAIPVCQQTYVETVSPSGTGNYPN